MALIFQALIETLQGDADLAALVETRVFPDRAPAGTAAPCITISRMPGSRVQSHDGQSGLNFARFDLRCWGKTTLEAEQVAEAARLALGVAEKRKYMGTSESVTVGRVGVDNGPGDDAFEAAENDGLRRATLQVRINHAEDKPAV